MSVDTTTNNSTAPTTVSVSNRSKTFEKIKHAHKKYNMTLVYAAPEIRDVDYLRRNPIVLMNDMAKKVPIGEEYDHFVEGFANLAFYASTVPLSYFFNDWWVPVGEKLLGDVIGECDTEWKEEAIKIWMDADYTKNNLD